MLDSVRWVLGVIGKHWRRIILVFFCSPFLLWALFWAGLATPWGKSFVADKIEDRTGLKAVIGSVGFLPFGEIWLKDLHIDPGGKVAAIEIDVEWWSLLRGDLVVRQVRVDRPVFDVNFTQLQKLIPLPQPMPSSSQNSSEKDSGIEEQSAAKPDRSNLNQKGSSGDPKDQSRETQFDTKRENTSGSSSEKLRATMWIEIENAEFTLRQFEGSKPLLRLVGASLKLPLDGTEGEGSFGFQELVLLGEKVSEEFSLPVENSKYFWGASYGFKVEDSYSDHSFQINTNLKIRKARGLPFGFSAAALHLGAFEAGQFTVAGELQALAQITGVIKNPGTWLGQAQFLGRQILLHSGSKLLTCFETVTANGVLSGGRLRTGVCRADGERGALVGFGELSSEGAAGVVRLVVAPEYKSSLDRYLNRIESRWVSADLDTPDRYFVDISVLSQEGRLGFRTEGGRFFSVFEALELVLVEETPEQGY